MTHLTHRVVRLLLIVGTAIFNHAAEAAGCNDLRPSVDATIVPLMTKQRIPGMAVGITDAGMRCFFTYGAASITPHRPVTTDTLFELGSISKTFTTTLAAYAQEKGVLSLAEKISAYLPEFAGHPFGEVSLIQLGTHTPGGFPLQVPEGIRNRAQLMAYFKAWTPTYPAGTHRTYANPSIGMLGWIAAQRLGQDFEVLMQKQLFPALGMKRSYIHVPASAQADYAQGYTAENAPIRLSPGMLSSEAYGVKSTVSDMVRFLEANMSRVPLDGMVQRALMNTHTGYFQVGPMTQDLVWEQYRYPVAVTTLVEGNAASMIYGATPVTALTPPLTPQDRVWINKTGATRGFGAYVAFIPSEQRGVVLLANKNYPNEERVKAAYAIVTALSDGGATSGHSLRRSPGI